ncbi:SET and MYND domain-containing protein DDB_G0284059-like [Mercenaria mercenaria]|uniref:SET and MYND domain-containing protein DDB_G0284059-like n=1 Tax=Mercenaria mercenaria TaxID=6596 RepID=UPI00234E3C45|nr:SET and MYND domain-containing protein DDB_G0284059-like [Mercenaria mercenaria]
MDKMETYILILILASLIHGVPAPGHTRMCRNCPHLVKGPSECKEIHHCQQFCITEVYYLHGENWLRYGCGGGAHSSELECEKLDHHHPHGHEHGPGHEHGYAHPVCRKCHYHFSSQQDSCSQYFLTTTHIPVHPVTHAPTTVVQSQCQWLLQCTAAPAITKASSAQTTTTPTTTTPTTTRTTTTSTTHVTVPATTQQNIMVTATSMKTTSQPCVDLDDVTFTCADMAYYGYCYPAAGAGYALAQKRCRKTCRFCP